MDYVTPILLLALMGLTAYALFFRKQGAGDASSALLIEDLRRQLTQATAAAERERAEKTAALEKASAAAAAAQAAAAQLTDARGRHDVELRQLRADSQKSLADAEARYNKALAELRQTFEKTSTDVLKGMTPDVTKEVSTKVEPLIEKINTALANYRQTMQQSLDKQGDALAQVREQMSRVNDVTAALATSTNDFTAVLKSSQHRGKWGEQTLRRVVEAAGLSPHCDFAEQVSQDDARPDLVVKLPDNRCVIIDSKVPEFDVAIADQAAPNRKELVAAHAAKLRKTMRDLAAKDYPGVIAKQGVRPFDKVVLFLPAESLLSTALEGDNELILDAAKLNILIATPATLMGFLSAINLSWQQHVQAENAGRIAQEAAELYDRVQKFIEHFGKARKGLIAAAENMDAAIGSYDSRVRPQGEKLRELGAASGRESLPELGSSAARIRRIEGSPE
ncbi:MAG: DNA recombination protein RmuC [Opitutia bacterium]|jgi:DNA recombination protein RmuC